MKYRPRIYACIVLLALWPAIRAVDDSSSGTSKRPSPTHGAAIYRKSCSVCHSVDHGETKVGPSLYGILRDGSGRSEQSVRQTIAQGKGTMPSFKEKFATEQMNDLIEYLKTL